MIKKTSGSSIKNENISNKELAKQLNKRTVTNFNKRKEDSLFIDNIWVADLGDIQLISLCFMKKNCKKQIKKNLKLKNLTREKKMNYMFNGNGTIIRLIVGFIKKIWYKLVKIELDLSSYATKTDLKNATGIHISSFARKVNLTILKFNVDKLRNDKLKCSK